LLSTQASNIRLASSDDLTEQRELLTFSGHITSTVKASLCYSIGYPRLLVTEKREVLLGVAVALAVAPLAGDGGAVAPLAVAPLAQRCDVCFL